MAELWAVILAAGEGKRMHSRLPKVLHPLCGRRMLEYILRSTVELTSQVLVVVGHGASQVQETLGDKWSYVLQEQQLGTGHAVMESLQKLPDKGILLVLCGDTPLLEASYLKKLINCYHEHKAAVATAQVPDPSGYGRVVRNTNGKVIKIVEDKDASDRERELREINTGTYCFDLELLRHYLPRLKTDNLQHEYYLPDVITMMHQDGYPVGACCLDDYRVGLGINNRAQLAEAIGILQQKVKLGLMQKGVTIEKPDTVYVDVDVQVGMDTVLRPHCVLEKGTIIGKQCIIGPGSYLSQAIVGDDSVISYSVVDNYRLEINSEVGPFAHLKGEG